MRGRSRGRGNVWAIRAKASIPPTGSGLNAHGAGSRLLSSRCRARNGMWRCSTFGVQRTPATAAIYGAKSTSLTTSPSSDGPQARNHPKPCSARRTSVQVWRCRLSPRGRRSGTGATHCRKRKGRRKGIFPHTLLGKEKVKENRARTGSGAGTSACAGGTRPVASAAHAGAGAVGFAAGNGSGACVRITMNREKLFLLLFSACGSHLPQKPSL